jgi:FkbM family methyltransferase
MLIPFNELFRDHNVKATRVLHLGANTGQEAQAYHDNGVRSVVWVEALPSLIPVLRKHVEPFGGQCLCACVSDVDGKDVQFNVANNGGQSSSFLEFGTHSAAHPTVTFTTSHRMQTVRVDTLLKSNFLEIREEDSWFLNADLQGAELLALKGMGDLLGRFNYAYIEVNDKELYKECPLTGEIDAHLSKFGFVGVQTKMTGWGWGDKFYARKR